MSQKDEITSVRIVCVDHYMKAPNSKFDSVYSEFRGSEVKQVPVIRMFGSTSNGTHVCVHIHGVYPYFYIPYDGSANEMLLVDRLMYQIASSLDKAINISLGRATSTNQHVFKISLVKGIPIYGYHAKEHQFLKIYLYNPLFIRKATSLLMNGAILSRTFQTYESHVPYILQFFIDYNLYGMSFLHVPSFKVIERKDGDETGDTPKMSTSQLEVDILAVEILNRAFLEQEKKSEYANPGIASIWNDEKERRSLLGMDFLESIVSSQKDQQENITESDNFYRNILCNKLNTFVPSLETGKTYPLECTESDEIMEASYVQDHKSSLNCTFDPSNSKYDHDTTVDEEKIISLSQKHDESVVLHEEDEELLEIMRQLEENEEKNIESDCLLAPLAQPPESQVAKTISLSQTLKKVDLSTFQEPEKEEEQTEIDSDDEFLLDYTLKMDAIQDIPSDNSSDDQFEDADFLTGIDIPQLDGADGSPKMHNIRKRRLSTLYERPEKIPKKSLRPNRITQVVFITPRKEAQNSLVAIENGESSRKLFTNGVSLKAPSIKNEETEEPKMKDLKIVVRKLGINEINKMIQDEFVSKNEKSPKNGISNSQVGKNKTALLKELQMLTDKQWLASLKIDQDENLLKTTVKRVSRKKLSYKEPLVFDIFDTKEIDFDFTTEKHDDDFIPNPKSSKKSNKKLKNLVREHDIRNNYFPKAGPSKTWIEKENELMYGDIIRNSPKVELQNCMSVKGEKSEKNSLKDIERRSSSESDFVLRVEEDDCNIESPRISSDWEMSCKVDDEKIHSFYEETLVFEPSFEISSSSSDSSFSELQYSGDDSKKVVIRVENCPPSYEDVMKSLENLEIPLVLNQEPFYSNYKDITGRKEVGHKVLQIPGNSFNDMEEFKSVVEGLGSLNCWRMERVKEIYGDQATESLFPGESDPSKQDRLKELLSSERRIAIHPAVRPPTKRDAKVWLKGNQKDFIPIRNDESPIKIRKEITKMCSTEIVEAEIRPLASPTCNLSTICRDGDKKRMSLVSEIISLNSSFTTSEPRPKFKVMSYSERRKLRRSSRTKGRALRNRLIDLNESIVIDDSSNDSTVISENSDCTIINSGDLQSKYLVNDLSGSIVNSSYGFKVNLENLQTAKATNEFNYLTILSVEIHVQTRGDLKPNPEIDPITALFYTVHNNVPENHPKFPTICGIIINKEQNNVDDKVDFQKYNKSSNSADMVTVENERELYEKFLMLISIEDPDIFTGYEIEMASWGYVIQRGYVLEMNLMKMLSRIPTADKVHVSEDEENELLEMNDYSAGLRIPGRILLDIWRLMRHEIALTSYSFENITYHILHRRVPLHSHRHLTKLWNKTYTKWIVIEYYLERVNGNLELLHQLDLVGRTCELAKLFGIQFYEVLSRGSQYRVESMMLRIAKPRNFVSITPSIQQRAHMKSPEYIPLILEPDSRFYSDPLIVLDFQSLYPSMIIAYNYCFSTCLGRVEHLGQTDPFEFGASQLKIPMKLLKKLVELDLVTVSPCGAVFVKSSVRDGILPRMLNEILNTRLMVKRSMKMHKENSVLQRVLHSRQLGLKLIANVTYGYTAANFSGRMPCVEIGDSVVSKGRETLERAIKMVENNEKWGAKVVYGDTDSLFVLCPGRTKNDAFQIGEEIAEAVTKENPPPVKLKLEKVYQPSILQTKKRYVGYMYETADQQEPIYEAKGIETVRRDGCPVVGKILEKVIRILFDTQDVSKVKEYVCRQFTKVLHGNVNVQDFIFAKEFRGESGYKPGACVPALELTRKWKSTDPRHEPRRGERVPYVIINGPPLVPLIRLVRSPYEVLTDSALKINSTYYITKAIIPPLNRCLLLIGADVNQWFNDLPRKVIMLHNSAGLGMLRDLQLPKKSTISQYFSTTSCITDCGNQTRKGICPDCKKKPQQTVLTVAYKMNDLERKLRLTEKMCQSCCQRTFETNCVSLDCPVLFLLNNKNREFAQVEYYRKVIDLNF